MQQRLERCNASTDAMKALVGMDATAGQVAALQDSDSELELSLDEALAMTFPASDPVSVDAGRNHQGMGQESPSRVTAFGTPAHL